MIDLAERDLVLDLLYAVHVRGKVKAGQRRPVMQFSLTLGQRTTQGASDFATITFDDGIVNALRQTLGTYRQASATTLPLGKSRR